MRRILSIVSLLLFLAGAAAAQNAYGPGRVDLPFIAGQYHEAGVVTIHNNNGGLLIDVQMENGWEMIELHVHAGWEGNPIPTTRKGNVIPGKFDVKYEYDVPVLGQEVYLDFVEDLQGFRWGEPYEPQRTRFIAVHAEVRKFDNGTGQTFAEGAWAHGDLEFAQGGWARWLKYEMAHKRNTHFIDSPVAGLIMLSPTEYVYTDESGAAPYFPGESGSFYLGSQYLGTTLLDHKVSPLDLFPVSDTDDPRVINMAVLLQSLDAGADPQPGISITEDVEACFDQAVASVGHIGITDWSDDPANPYSKVNLLVDATINNCSGIVTLAKVSPEDAQANLDRSLNSAMFRKNISRTPELASSKAKLNVMGVWFPALRANGDPAYYLVDEVQVEGIPYYDEEGTFIRAATEAKPLAIVFTDADPETGAHDVWARVSRDDGNTWKKKNLSRMAYRSSFTLANGYPYYGHCKKPVFQVKGNKILVAWTTKFARGGRPGYAINLCDDPDTLEVETPDSGCAVYCTGDPADGTEVCEPDYPYDDLYWKDDIWGVSGPQRSVDYTDEGYPEVGEVPYSAVWVARGLILTAKDLLKAPFNSVSEETGALYAVGDIVWFKPERLTSARRDANQVFMGGADGAGLAIAWQEDPGGLRPGEAKGPGPGWGGATTNHKTDIWYSYITWADFAKVDVNFVSGGDPQHEDPDFLGRPKALVPMSLPVRISDNDVVNTHNMFIELGPDDLPVVDDDNKLIPMLNPDTSSDDSDGSHRYGYMVEGLWDWDGEVVYEGDTVVWDGISGGTLYQFTNQQDELKTVVVTADGRPLDGNTGASRANLFLQTYTKPDGTKSAWAIMAYEETKGVGLGPSEDIGTGGEPQDGSGYDPLETFPDEGKNAIYHSFDFQNPDLVSAGTILNLPETDAAGDPIYVVEVPCFGSDENGLCIVNPAAGLPILDWKGDQILAYENARRPRFILQSKAAAFGGFMSDGVTFKEPGNSGTVLIVLYKEGEEGAGRQSDIVARRCVVKDPGGNIRGGNPWSPNNFLPHEEGDLRQGERGVQNVSTVTPLETWINPDRDLEAKGDGTKVCTWEQPEANLWLKSSVNPYEDARAHRGGIRGDFVVMGYSFTPNWAASRNAHDKYDFYIRRSFNGGETWTTDPDTDLDVIVEHTDIFIDPDGVSGSELSEMGDDISEATKHYEVVTEYSGGGDYEKARNVSLLKNNKTSIIEPRIVAVPGTIKDDGVWTGILEDKQNRDVFYVAYGTSTNLPDVDKAPEDLFYSFSMDQGTTLFEDVWVVNPDSSGNWPGVEVSGWGRLAKSEAEDGEVQLRMTPDGSRFYSCWLEEGEEGSDILFRRITPKEFPANTVPE